MQFNFVLKKDRGKDWNRIKFYFLLHSIFVLHEKEEEKILHNGNIYNMDYGTVDLYS